MCLVNRLLTEYHLEVNVGRPQVVYRETIEKEVEATAKFVKEMDEVKHFERCSCEFRPTDVERELSFIRSTGRNAACRRLSSIEEGVRESSTVGVIWVIHDRSACHIIKSQYRSRASSPLALKIASSNAVREGCRKAQPVLMEPMMEVNIIVPEEFMAKW